MPACIIGQATIKIVRKVLLLGIYFWREGLEAAFGAEGGERGVICIALSPDPIYEQDAHDEAITPPVDS
ncbi:MAG: hypothetical protein QNK82_11910, partial [Akkermansiaceae bacterium]